MHGFSIKIYPTGTFEKFQILVKWYDYLLLDVYIYFIFIYGELLICNSLTRVLHIICIFIMQFQKANDFNQNISCWTVTSAKEMQFMVRLFNFYRCFMPMDTFLLTYVSFSSALYAIAMQFEGALSFNQDLSSWDVRNNEQFYNMFTNARSFNQSLCPWSLAIQATTNVTGMFSGTSCLNTSDPTSSGGPFLSNGPFCHPCNQREYITRGTQISVKEG